MCSTHSDAITQVVRITRYTNCYPCVNIERIFPAPMDSHSFGINSKLIHCNHSFASFSKLITNCFARTLTPTCVLSFIDRQINPLDKLFSCTQIFVTFSIFGSNRLCNDHFEQNKKYTQLFHRIKTAQNLFKNHTQKSKQNTVEK